MINLTQKELYEIIDSLKPHAKKICDDIYTETAKEIGDNKQFKTILDNSFNPIVEMEIEGLKNYFNTYFSLTNFSEISIEKIIKLISIRGNTYAAQIRRKEGKILTRGTTAIIHRAATRGFIENLCECLGLDVKEIINYK